MRIKERMKKGFSVLLALNMVLSSVPLPVFAAEGCTHHTEHTAECGYVEAVAGVPCAHVHNEDCYAIVSCLHECGDECAQGCGHSCTVESGCITMERNCQHTHGGCGYSEGTAEVLCGHVHDENCSYVAADQGTACGHSCADQGCTLNEDGTYTCLHAEHDEVCGYVEGVEGVPCGHTEHIDCGYAPATQGTPCTHVCEVKVNSSESCNKLLCSHKDGGHDEVCGYVAAVEGHECHYECAECAIAPANEEPGDETPVCTCNAVEGEAHTEGCALYVAPADPVCTCEVAEGEAHIEGCALYVAPAEPVCYCVEKCTAEAFNEYCEVCGVDYSKCTGTDTAAVYAPSITGVKITVDGQEYTSGHVTITPEIQSIIITVTGNNFASMTPSTDMEQYYLWYGWNYAEDLFYCRGDQDSVTVDLSERKDQLKDCNDFEIRYSVDGRKNWIGTGIYLTYDDSSEVVIPAQITGVKLTVDGKDYTSGHVWVNSETESIVFTVSGTNMENRSENNVVLCSSGIQSLLTNWLPGTQENTVTASAEIDWYVGYSNIEIQYSNDGGSTWTGTGISVSYCSNPVC